MKRQELLLGTAAATAPVRARTELAAHPDVFLKILRGSDLAAACDAHRMGAIFGGQLGMKECQ